MSTDPFENIRRQQEQLRRALEGPRQQFARNQAAPRKALEGPLADYARIQQQTARALEAPAIRALEQQRAFREAVDGPLRAVAENQRRVREALKGPLEQIRRNQEALARAMEGPFAVIARNQELMRSAMEALAAAEPAAGDEVDELEGIDSEQAAWLREWIAAIGEWAPTWEQVEVFLNALSLLLALISMPPVRPTQKCPMSSCRRSAFCAPPGRCLSTASVTTATSNRRRRTAALRETQHS